MRRILRHGLSGLADSAAPSTADQITSLTAQQKSLQDSITSITNQITYANQQYNVDHFGGQSPDQFGAYVSMLQGQLQQAQTQLQTVSDKLNTLQGQQTTAQTTSPAAVAAAGQAATQSYIQQVRLLSTAPIYDYGAKSGDRNAFYGVSGLSAGLIEKEDSDMPNQDGSGGLYYSGPALDKQTAKSRDGGLFYAGGLGLNILDDLKQGVLNTLPAVVVPDLSKVVDYLGLPTTVPAPIQTLAQGVQSQVNADKSAQAYKNAQSLVAQSAQLPQPGNAGHPIAAAAQNAGLVPSSSTEWLYIGGGLIALLLVVAAVRK